MGNDLTIDSAKELLRNFTDHFIVKSGRNDATNQYGHLELWWAAKSVGVYALDIPSTKNKASL